MSANDRERFVRALDRLRASSLSVEVDGNTRHCVEGLSLRLREANDKRRAWDMCRKPGAHESAPYPDEVSEVLGALSEHE